jgi:hypothetical protein
MTNASAMTLSLVVFIALFFGAIFVIFGGGGLFVRRDRPKPQRGSDLEPERSRRAA